MHRRQNDFVSPIKETSDGYLSLPPPSQTAHAAEASDNNEKKTTKCPPPLPHDLDAIKEFIQHDKDDDYIALMSAIALKEKKNECSSYPLKSTTLIK